MQTEKGHLDSKGKRKSSPFHKKSSYQGKSQSLQKDNGLKRVMSRPEKNRRLLGKKAEQLKKDSENLKRGAWG